MTKSSHKAPPQMGAAKDSAGKWIRTTKTLFLRQRCLPDCITPAQPPTGLEPASAALEAQRSSIELRRHLSMSGVEPPGRCFSNNDVFQLHHIDMAPPVGLEPTPSAFVAQRSSIELRRHIGKLTHEGNSLPEQIFEQFERIGTRRIELPTSCFRYRHSSTEPRPYVKARTRHGRARSQLHRYTLNKLHKNSYIHIVVYLHVCNRRERDSNPRSEMRPDTH